MSILSVILTLVRLAGIVMTWAQQNKWMTEGADREVARATADLFRKTEHAKAVRSKIDAMDENEVDELLASFEPPVGGVRNDKPTRH
jgi:hypothetical protein